MTSNQFLFLTLGELLGLWGVVRQLDAYTFGHVFKAELEDLPILAGIVLQTAVLTNIAL